MDYLKRDDFGDVEKYKERLKNEKVQILSSGSKGNCVIIGDLMVDCGLGFKDIKSKLGKINVLFITHKHSDHLNKSTIKNIRVYHPRIKIIGNYEVGQVIRLDKVTVDFKPLKMGKKLLVPFPCVHDVVTQGIMIKSDINVVYATDTVSLNHVPKMKYDMMFIESNHDEKKMQGMINGKKDYGYDVFKNANRHLSTQKCKNFYYMNRRNKDSLLFEMHISARFY